MEFNFDFGAFGNAVAPRYQIFLVQSSFGLLDAASTKTLLDLFYEKLFELDPRLEKLFNNTHMEEQKKKLGELITVGITTLNNFPKEVQQALQNLGKRHVKYGVTEQDY